MTCTFACGFYNSGFDTAACVIADGAGSFLQYEGIEDVMFEFESIYKADYGAGENFRKYSNILEQKQLIGCNQVDDGIWLTEYPGHTKCMKQLPNTVDSLQSKQVN